MSYLSYSEYQNMGGTLDETAFSELSYEAEAKIDWYTFNRLKEDVNIPDAVKRCEYKLIKLIQSAQNSEGVGDDSSNNTSAIASQSNDGVSISYNVLSASEIVTRMDTEIKSTIYQYLQGVKNSLGQVVLYRGLYPGE